MKKYIDENQKGISNGIAPLNASKKIDSSYLPSYTDVNYIPSNSVPGLDVKQTWTYEQTFNFDDYGLSLYDNISGIAAGFKAPRGLFNQLFVDDIVFVREDNTTTSGMTEGISFYTWNGVTSKAAIKDADGNITTDGYNRLGEYTKVATITRDGGLVLRSPGGKYFKLSIDDNGNISTAQYTYTEPERYEQE